MLTAWLCLAYRTIDEVDARLSFAKLDHRGPTLFNNAASLLENTKR